MAEVNGIFISLYYSLVQVIWKESRVDYSKRFNKYLDPNFFQHRVRHRYCGGGGGGG